MPANEPVHQYVVFDAERLMSGKLDEQPLTVEMIAEAFRDLLQRMNIDLSGQDYTIDSVPLVKFYPGEEKREESRWTPQEVFSVSSPNRDAALRFRDAVVALIDHDRSLVSIGTDPAISLAEFSVPVAPDAALFGTLADARRLIRTDQLPVALDGHSVNVVVIDTGINQSIVPLGQFGGGWQPQPGGANLPPPPPPGMTIGSNALHGMMVVENILAMAPKARIFDVPLIPPPKIFDIFSFLNVAEAAYKKILADILYFQSIGSFPGSWILVNAWAIYDRRSEGPFLGEYTENLGPSGVPPHPFIKLIEDVAANHFDIVFCAGNCGEICPDDRCGPNDYGPGRGIWGANAHKDVLTTGAVRVDTIWPGYSSEGPGPTPNLDALKPDLCAPAQFVGTSGLYPPNTGTSTSAAVAAGVVCALRSRNNWDQATVPPSILKLVLNSTAMQTQGIGWNRWLGNGVLDAYAAYQMLLAAYP
jgi:hypothetical protein